MGTKINTSNLAEFSSKRWPLCTAVIIGIAVQRRLDFRGGALIRSLHSYRSLNARYQPLDLFKVHQETGERGYTHRKYVVNYLEIN